GNLTGFTVIEPSLGPKMLELLKEIAPPVSRVAIMLNPDNSDLWQAYFAAAAAKLALEVVATPVREPAEINAAITKLGGEPNPGLIVLPDPATNSHRKLIVQLAARFVFVVLISPLRLVGAGSVVENVGNVGIEADRFGEIGDRAIVILPVEIHDSPIGEGPRERTQPNCLIVIRNGAVVVALVLRCVPA